MGVPNAIEPQIMAMFEAQQAQINRLNANNGLTNVDNHNLSSRTQIYQNALAQANQGKSQLLGQAVTDGGQAVNIALKTLLIYFARRAAEDKLKKVVAKELAKGVAKAAAEKLGKEAAEKSAQKFLKFVPFVGVIMGVGLAINRGVNGDPWYLIGGELLSGAASCAPGYGSAVSLGLDAAMLAYDVKKTIDLASATPSPNTRNTFASISDSYGCLGIQYTVGDAEPTRERVVAAHREMIQQFHPDRAAVQSVEIQQRFHRFTVIINESKEFIFTNRGWSL